MADKGDLWIVAIEQQVGLVDGQPLGYKSTVAVGAGRDRTHDQRITEPRVSTAIVRASICLYRNVFNGL